MYTVIILPRVQKSLRKYKNPILKRILTAIKGLKDDPRPPGAKKLVGEENVWRVRVGDYRILYTIEDEIRIITVERVAHRKDSYRKK
ncbi:MAG: type II toxin-antitoxin system RelE/ParE family toxin [Bacteroidota bacterium]